MFGRRKRLAQPQPAHGGPRPRGTPHSPPSRRPARPLPLEVLDLEAPDLPGEFVVRNLPPGEHALVAFHAERGLWRGSVVLEPEAPTRVEATVTPLPGHDADLLRLDLWAPSGELTRSRWIDTEPGKPSTASFQVAAGE